MTPRRRQKMTIQAAVKEIVLQDKRIQKIMNTPYFNTSAYAREIQKQVEKMVGTRVKLNTITVSLKRLQRRLKSLPTAESVSFEVSDLQVKAPVKMGVYEANRTVLMFIGNLLSDKRAQERLFYTDVHRDQVLVVYPRDMQESLAKIDSSLQENGGDYAMLVVKVEKDDVSEVVEEIASRLSEEGVKTRFLSVHKGEVVFVIPYNELIKVLAWFS